METDNNDHLVPCPVDGRCADLAMTKQESRFWRYFTRLSLGIAAPGVLWIAAQVWQMNQDWRQAMGDAVAVTARNTARIDNWEKSSLAMDGRIGSIERLVWSTPGCSNGIHKVIP